MTYYIVCPKCRRKGAITLSPVNLMEVYLTGNTNIAIYHTDHMVLLNLDEYGIRSINVCDPPSQLVHSINIIVGNYQLLRTPLIDVGFEAIFVDSNKKIVDARMIGNHMHAISFVRFLQRYIDKIPRSAEKIDVYGLKFVVERNGDYIVGLPITEKNKDRTSDMIRYFVQNIKNIPVDTSLVLEVDTDI